MPTAVYYSRGHFLTWGFLATNPNYGEGKVGQVYEKFKTYFDPAKYRNARECGPAFPPSHEHVRTFYRDFLRCIRLHIEMQLTPNIKVGWDKARVEFMFSTSTTWSSVVVNDFAGLIQEAGFGTDGLEHSCSVTLTEAQAVAMYLSYGDDYGIWQRSVSSTMKPIVN